MIYLFDPATRRVNAGLHGEVEGPCFLATITSIQTGMRDRAAILSCAYELQAYLTCAEDVVIEGVQMLCPPAVTGKEGWSLEELVEVVLFVGVETDDSAVVYRTSEGIYKLGELDLRRKKTSRVWYSEQSVRSHLPRPSNRFLCRGANHLYSATR